jgi:hypothetical protein
LKAAGAAHRLAATILIRASTIQLVGNSIYLKSGHGEFDSVPFDDGTGWVRQTSGEPLVHLRLIFPTIFDS